MALFFRHISSKFVFWIITGSFFLSLGVFRLQAGVISEKPSYPPTFQTPNSTLGQSYNGQYHHVVPLSSMVLNENPSWNLMITCTGEMRFIKENAKGEAGFIFNRHRDAWSAHYTFQGFHLYNTQTAAVGYARQIIPNLSIASQVSFRTASAVENRSRDNDLNLQLASIYRIRYFSFFFSYQQEFPLSKKNYKVWNRAITLETGSVFGKEKLWIEGRLSKDLREPLAAHICLGHHFFKAVSCFAQSGINPVYYRLGGYFLWKNLKIQLSFTYHTPLGLESRFSVMWNLKQKDYGERK